MMDVENYLNKMKGIQTDILKYIEKTEKSDESYNDLIKSLNDKKIQDNQFEIKSVLHLILNIANNHHRQVDFFSKIFKIILNYQTEIKKHFSNYEIYNIFKSNNRIVLFLIEENLLTVDEIIANNMKKTKIKTNFFFNEIKQFLDEKTVKKMEKEIPKDINNRRRINENDNELCCLIRNDSLDDFIKFVKEKKLNLNSSIKPSIFETNNFLIGRETNIIEYAAFFGSMNIFKYLNSNKIELTPSLWLYAIHSQNFELIQFLRDNQIHPSDGNFDKFLIESIKCHHIDITKFIASNFYKNDDFDFLSKSLKYYNFAFIQKESINESAIYDLCHYDYFLLVENLLKTANIDINSTNLILFKNVLIQFKNFFKNEVLNYLLE